MTDIDQLPAGRETDALVAEKVMADENLPVASYYTMFESIHDCMVEIWDWIVEILCPFVGVIWLFRLAVALLILVALLRGCLQ